MAMNIREAIQKKARQALGIEKTISGEQKGFFGFKAEPMFGMYDIVKEGDVNSMLRANLGRVWACVNVLSLDMAQVPIELYVPGKEEDKQIYEHPFFDLLKTDPFHNSWELKYLTEAHLDITGNAYWLMELNSFDRPVTIRFLHSNRVEPKWDKIKKAKYYEYNDNGTIRRFEDEEIIHFKFPHCTNDLKGMGPVEASRKKINLLDYMEEYGVATFGNRGIPPGKLKVEQPISQDEANKLRLEWKKLYGGIEKTGEIAVFGKGADFEPIILNPQELQYLASTEFTEDGIGAMFGVPPQKLGRVKDVNRANSEAVDYEYRKDTLTPRLTIRDIYLTEECVQKYDKKLFVKSPSVVPKDKDFELRKDTEFVSRGVFSINQVLKKWGYDPVPEGEERLVPFNLVPLSSISSVSRQFGNIPMKSNKASCAFHSKEWKEQYWKAYVGRTLKKERGMISLLGQFFDKQQHEVISNLHKYGKAYKASEVYLPSRDAENKKLIAIIKPIIQANVVAGGNHLAMDFGLGGFEEYSLSLEQFFKLREMLIKNINETTFEKLLIELEEGVNNGETIKELSKRVDNVYSEAKGYRSFRIARTEVNTATNFGHIEAMRQALIEEKEWTTAMDEKVRETHTQNQLDGCIPLEHSFSGTGESYPGEISCRCVVIPCLERR